MNEPILIFKKIKRIIIQSDVKWWYVWSNEIPTSNTLLDIFEPYLENDQTNFYYFQRELIL
jgi:hypothetical protein